MTNNQTKKLELAKIYNTISKHYESYTCYHTTGVWQGKQERSVRIDVITDKKNHNQVAKELKQACRQDAILVEVSKVNSKLL